jgi:serine/threonine protein kinase
MSRSIPGKRSRDISEAQGGTSGYRPPELQLKKHFSLKTDIWAIGCLIIPVVTTGMQDTFRDDSAALNYANGIEGYRRPLTNEDNTLLPSTFLEQLERIMGECLETEPNQRPHVMTLLQRFLELNKTLMK